MKAAANTLGRAAYQTKRARTTNHGHRCEFSTAENIPRQRAQGARWIAPSTDPPTAERLESH
jgi:hypothetical protein